VTSVGITGVERECLGVERTSSKVLGIVKGEGYTRNRH
jgi:hypothetical protein